MSSKREDALAILNALGMPRAQLNDRSALTLLALLDLTPRKKWSASQNPLIGVTPIMDWMRKHYNVRYAPNTRETIRRQTLHQFVDANLACYNPDVPDRPVNSPDAVYQISPDALRLCQSFRTDEWKQNLAAYLKIHPSLARQYSAPRNTAGPSVTVGEGITIKLSPGRHSELISDVATSFLARFAKRGILLYAGDTGNKDGHFDQERLEALGLSLDKKGKLPDLIIFDPSKNWFLLIEAVTSHGPMDAKRKRELSRIFEKSNCGVVFVTAFPNKKTFNKYLAQIAWVTEVWVADCPDHMIHFNGDRFLGPYG